MQVSYDISFISSAAKPHTQGMSSLTNCEYDGIVKKEIEICVIISWDSTRGLFCNEFP